jgi:hypothetical protein
VRFQPKEEISTPDAVQMILDLGIRSREHLMHTLFIGKETPVLGDFTSPTTAVVHKQAMARIN